MKWFNILFFIVLTFVLGSCTKNTEIKEITNTANISNEKTKEIKKELLDEQNWRIDRILIWEFKTELDKNSSEIIDLRTTAELEKTWTISWAKQIDFYSSVFKEKVNSLDKNKKYLIYCRSGNRSSKTLSLMKDLWFTNVLELQWWMNNWIASWKKTVTYSSDTMLMKMNSDMMDEMIPQVITLNAKNWEFDQKIIKAKKWQKLTIKVNNIDRLHWIAIPAMKIIWDSEIEVDTSKMWEFEFRCLNYCGEWHQDMTWKIIIE
jgi:rhodanese-related sulfurtransferase